MQRDLPGLNLSVDVPSDWLTVQPRPLLFTVLEPVEGLFPSTVTVVVDEVQRQPLPDPSAAAAALLILPLVLAISRPPTGATVDLLLTHIAGTTSLTSLQRQTPSAAGLVVVTVSTPTSRWKAVAPLARRIVSSVRSNA